MRVSVDGGIGAGKSSVLASLRERGFLTVPEPVDSWQEMLARMYDDPTRWSASFNINVLLSFAESLDDSRNVCVYERSPLSTMHVFSVLQERLGFMTGHEMQLIRRIFRQVAWIPDVIVYLQTRPEVAYERMQERGRRAESSVPYSYLEELHEEYERFMGIYVYSSELDRPLVTFRYDDKEETLEVCPPFSSEIVRVDSSSLWFKAFVADSVVNIHDNLTLIVHAENARNRSPGNALAAIGECLNARSHRFAEVVLLWSDDRGHVQRYTIMRHNAQSTT